jgi:hypothetical protein
LDGFVADAAGQCLLRVAVAAGVDGTASPDRGSQPSSTLLSPPSPPPATVCYVMQVAPEKSNTVVVWCCTIQTTEQARCTATQTSRHVVKLPWMVGDGNAPAWTGIEEGCLLFAVPACEGEPPSSWLYHLETGSIILR